MSTTLIPFEELGEDFVAYGYPEDEDYATITETDIADDIAAEWAEWMADEEKGDYDPPCCSGRGSNWNPASWCGCQR